MKFHSTRDAGQGVDLSSALLQGIAADGGLYVPAAIPRLAPTNLPSGSGLAPLAAAVLAPYFEGDQLQSALEGICERAFNFPVCLRPLPDPAGPVSLLELFHGPTAAFKDFGARFLAACLQRVEAGPDDRPLTILVATSGDTGGAVAAAFHRQPGTRVVILFPAGAVSPVQEMQLTCWGDNVMSLAIEGTFDDCQALAKAAFADAQLREQRRLGSANSINIGRLLPQAAYFAWASLRIWASEGRPANFIIPSGNLGHASACVLARKMGLPIAEIVLAHNANRAVPDFLDTGTWQPAAGIATIASAMDVGDPSNLERLRYWYPDFDELRASLRASWATDGEIRASIRSTFTRCGQVICPHTGAAVHALGGLSAEERKEGHWVVVATAHPAKFAEIVEPLVGRPLEVPASLAGLASRPRHSIVLPASLEDLRERLLQS